MPTGMGEIDYPSYLKEFHAVTMYGISAEGTTGADGSIGLGNLTTNSMIVNTIGLSTNMRSQINWIIGSNILSGISAFNPDGLITSMGVRRDALSTYVDSLDELTDWDGMVTQALDRIDELVGDEDAIEDEVAAFEEVSRRNLAKAYSRFDAGMFDIGAVVSSVFPAGRAIIEAEYNHDVARFRTERWQQRNRERSALIMQSVSAMTGILLSKGSLLVNAYQLTSDNAKFQIAAKTEQTRIEIGYRTDQLMWAMRAIQSAQGTMGAIGSISTVPQPLTPLQTLVGGLTTTATVAGGLLGVSPEAAAIVGGLGIFLSFVGAAEAGGFK